MKKRLVVAAALGLLAARRLLVSPYDLQGKVVLITGGSRGLGLALAREFASRGARLALLARDPEELGVAGAELRARGAEVRELVADLARPQEAERAVAELLDYYGGLDVLVNSVGVIQASPLANLTLDDYHRAMDINFYGPLHAMLAARPALARSGGRILNVSSVGGKVGVPHLASYSASKFALVGLGQAWRAELRREGVTLTTVCPGLMRTGSARHVVVGGKAETEYALFATLDNLPVLSLDAAEAARRMVQAMVRGDAETVIGGPARLLTALQSLAPQLTAELLGLGSRLLPAPAESDGKRVGAEVESALTRANPLKRRAEGEFNES